MTDEQLHEALELWPAWQILHEHLSSTDPRTSDPRDLVGALCYFGIARAACLLHGNYIGQTLAASFGIVGQLLDMARDGRRPRFGAELGLRVEDFG